MLFENSGSRELVFVEWSLRLVGILISMLEIHSVLNTAGHYLHSLCFVAGYEIVVVVQEPKEFEIGRVAVEVEVAKVNY